MSTCLFTGAVLDRQTPMEHTIPRALGGRFRSNQVASAEFNHACGDTIDPKLNLAFALIMNELAPLLSTEHQPGAIPASVKDRPGRYVVERGGVLSRLDLEITKDPKTGMPKGVSGPDQAFQRFAKKSKFRVTDLPPIPSCDVTRAEMRIPLLSADMELCAIKSALLTFDHLLAGHPNRFTRSESLQEVLERIECRVLEAIPKPFCNLFV